jgi:hypothetical protein
VVLLETCRTVVVVAAVVSLMLHIVLCSRMCRFLSQRDCVTHFVCFVGAACRFHFSLWMTCRFRNGDDVS